MRYPLQILSLLAIHWTAGSDILGAHGNEGGRLHIECPYPDGYQNLPKYVCRDPCGRKDVLIRSERSDTYVRSGRFSLYDNSLMRIFTMTIKKLSLQDGAIYYCGIDTWGKDRKNKVKVTVSEARAPVTTLLPSAVTVQNGRDSKLSSSSRTPFTAVTDLSMETATVPLPFIHLDGNKGVASSFILVAAALSVLVCLFLAVLAVLLRGRSVSISLAVKPADLSLPVDSVQDEEEHVYDEYSEAAVYSTISLSQESAEEGYFMVQTSHHASEANENDLYSLVMPH